MLLEKITRHFGYDGSQKNLYDFFKGPTGHHIVQVSPAIAKARWATLCGLVEGGIGGLAFTAYYTRGVEYGPGDLTPILIGGGSMASGAVVLGGASCASSLRESSGFLTNSPLRFVADGALTGFIIGGVYTNTMLQLDAENPLGCGVQFTLLATLVGAGVGAAVTVADSVTRYTMDFFTRRRD